MTESREVRDDGQWRRWCITQDLCPECGGNLDTGWECTRCGFDCMNEYMSMRLQG